MSANHNFRKWKRLTDKKRKKYKKKKRKNDKKKKVKKSYHFRHTDTEMDTQKWTQNLTKRVKRKKE